MSPFHSPNPNIPINLPHLISSLSYLPPNLNILPTLLLGANQYHYRTGPQCQNVTIVEKSVDVREFLDVIGVYKEGTVWQSGESVRIETWTQAQIREYLGRDMPQEVDSTKRHNKRRGSRGTRRDSNVTTGQQNAAPLQPTPYMPLSQFQRDIKTCIQVMIPPLQNKVYCAHWTMRDNISEVREMDYKLWLRKLENSESHTIGRPQSASKHRQRKLPRNPRLVPPTEDSLPDFDEEDIEKDIQSDANGSQRSQFTLCADFQVRQELQDQVDDIISLYKHSTGMQIENVECYFVYSKLREPYLIAISDMVVPEQIVVDPNELVEKPRHEEIRFSTRLEVERSTGSLSPDEKRTQLHEATESHDRDQSLLADESTTSEQVSPSQAQRTRGKKRSQSPTDPRENYQKKRKDSLQNYLPDASLRRSVESPFRFREKKLRESQESVLESLRRSSLRPSQMAQNQAKSPKRKLSKTIPDIDDNFEYEPLAAEQSLSPSGDNVPKRRSSAHPSSRRFSSHGLSTAGAVTDRIVILRHPEHAQATDSAAKLLHEIKSQIKGAYEKTELASRIGGPIAFQQLPVVRRRASSPPPPLKIEPEDGHSARTPVRAVSGRRTGRRKSTSKQPPKHMLSFDVSLNASHQNGTSSEESPQLQPHEPRESRPQHIAPRSHQSARSYKRSRGDRKTTPGRTVGKTDVSKSIPKLFQSPAAVRIKKQKKLEEHAQALESKPEWSATRRMSGIADIYNSGPLRPSSAGVSRGVRRKSEHSVSISSKVENHGATPGQSNHMRYLNSLMASYE